MIIKELDETIGDIHELITGIFPFLFLFFFHPKVFSKKKKIWKLILFMNFKKLH